eukprot:256672_1
MSPYNFLCRICLFLIIMVPQSRGITYDDAICNGDTIVGMHYISDTLLRADIIDVSDLSNPMISADNTITVTNPPSYPFGTFFEVISAAAVEPISAVTYVVVQYVTFDLIEFEFTEIIEIYLGTQNDPLNAGDITLIDQITGLPMVIRLYNIETLGITFDCA